MNRWTVSSAGGLVIIDLTKSRLTGMYCDDGSLSGFLSISLVESMVGDAA